MSFHQSHFHRNATWKNPSSHLGDRTCCFLQKPRLSHVRAPIPCTFREVLCRRGWALPEAWQLEGQVPPGRKITLLLISSGTHSRFPAPSLHPSQTFVTAPYSVSVTTLSPLTVGRGCVQHRDHRPLRVGGGSERLPCPGPASRQNYVPNVFLEAGLA